MNRYSTRLMLAGIGLSLVCALPQAAPVATAIHAADAAPKKTIAVNFDSTDPFVESDDQKGTAAKSGLTAEQKKAVIAVMQKEYDDAVGAGLVLVKEGGEGDVKLIINGGRAPAPGTEYGDAGKPGTPGIIHAGEFVADKLADKDLTNAIGETAAHEAGHKLGLAHNADSPVSKMTSGELVDLKARAGDNRKFNPADISRLKATLNLKSAEQKDTKAAGQLGTFVGINLAGTGNRPDDNTLDAVAVFASVVADARYGYISITGEFVDLGGVGSDGWISFLYTASEQMAVQANGYLTVLTEPWASLLLDTVNPNNTDVFLHASMRFDADHDGGFDSVLDLNVFNRFATTGGFLSVPEPAVPALVALALVLLGAVRHGRRALAGTASVARRPH